MKLRFRYRYDRLQEELIQRLAETDVKMRIKADRTIEFAEKWYPDVDEKVNDIRFDIFERPLVRRWVESMDISEILHQFADRNIPFVIENHNGTEWIVYEAADVETVCQIECDLGLNRIE